MRVGLDRSKVGPRNREKKRKRKKKYDTNMALHSRDYAKPEDFRELSVFRVLLKSHACEKRTILTIRLLLRCRRVFARLLKCEESNLLRLKVLRLLLVARGKDSADSHFLSTSLTRLIFSRYIEAA